MTTITDGPDRLRAIAGELREMRHEIDQARPNSTSHEHPLDMAWHFVAQAESGCEQAIRYLEMGG